jgi:HTH-type transcriptional regulator / antitoxin HipB
MSDRPLPEIMARTPSQVGAALRRQRRLRGRTQRDVAGRAGLRQATVSAAEMGRHGTHLATLCDLLAALDLELIVRPRSKDPRIPDPFAG